MKSEPALITGVVVSAIIALAAHFNVVLDDASLTTVLAPIVTAILVRFRVSPAAKSE